MLFHGVIVLLQLCYCCLAPFDTTSWLQWRYGFNGSLHIISAFDVMPFIDVTPHMAFNCGDSSAADVLSACGALKSYLCSTLALSSSLIVWLPPLHGLPFRYPCTGCAHFLQGRQNIPSSARCAGHIVMLAPSSRKWAVQARIKSLTTERLLSSLDATWYLSYKNSKGKGSWPLYNTLVTILSWKSSKRARRWSHLPEILRLASQVKK